MKSSDNNLRYGFTTGSCAAAAAKAAAYMLFFGKETNEIEVMTPKGVLYRAKVHDVKRSEFEVSCAVIKDGGDDPDVTTGALIYARVWIGDFTRNEINLSDNGACQNETDNAAKERGYAKKIIENTVKAEYGTKNLINGSARASCSSKNILDSVAVAERDTKNIIKNTVKAENGTKNLIDNASKSECNTKKIIDNGVKENLIGNTSKAGCGAKIFIDGGIGVGRVTKPGLDQPVGCAAINRVPREMITKEVMNICDIADFHGNVHVEISVPGGDELSKKTFNPRLGIEGGISIIGTTGIVEPMSEQALLDTILVEIKQHRALGENIIAVSPGNYGLDFMKREFGYDLDKSVKCSNFVGDTVDMAVKCGFEKMLLTGHIGKLIKISGGMMNTHSKYGDCRMELLSAAALIAGINTEKVLKILSCVSTEEALSVIYSTSAFTAVMDVLMDKIMFNLNARAGGKIQIECIMYSNGYGLLAKSSNALEFIKYIKKE